MVGSQLGGQLGLTLIAAASVLLAGLLAWRTRHLQRRLQTAQDDKEAIERRFAPALDLDAERTRLRGEIATVRHELDQLRVDYREKRAIHSRMVNEIAVFDDRLTSAELGVYEPHFDFTDSEKYKEETERVRGRQKGMVNGKIAVVCATQWTVEGSAAKGRTMADRQIKLALRAFNGECDAAIANARWNNVAAMEKRIERAFTQINKLNASVAVSIAYDYFELKVEELRLTHEHRDKQRAEREERVEAARLAREEAKLLRDAENAERDEERYQRLLNKAKAEAASIVGPKLDAFRLQIEVLERDLAEAHARAERARSMAEQTRSGYVYVISNVGSFGEEMVKIGLTRRLDPDDRIRELGDASVPFLFDTHAMIYSEDAPALERVLHAQFVDRRVNSSNFRKEFFRATLGEIEAAVHRVAPAAGFFKDREAREYRETLARRRAALDDAARRSEALYPVDL